MPIYEWACIHDGHPRQEHFLSMDARDAIRPKCHVCGKALKRLPGGHGLLFFEEGRGRNIVALSGKPISSHAEHKRLMRKAGVREGGNTPPPGILKRGPKSRQMKEFLSKDQKGRWL